MPSYDFTIQDHAYRMEYDLASMGYVAFCVCGWTSPLYREQFRVDLMAKGHVAERERAAEAAREKTRYLINEEP